VEGGQGGACNRPDPDVQSLWKMTRWVLNIPTPPILVAPGGLALSDSEKAEALTDSMEAYFSR